MNISHPLVFSPRTTFNETISSSDARGAILIGIASTVIGSFLNSIANRLLAHTPGRDIVYDKWLRNMIFHTGFSKNLLTWLCGSDNLRESHYYDNRKPIHISRVIIPLTLRILVLGVTMALMTLSIPRDTQFSSRRGVGIKAYLGGNGTESIGILGCESFRKNPGRFTQAVDLQICALPVISILRLNQSFGENNGLLAVSIEKDRSRLIVGVSLNATVLVGSVVFARISGQTHVTTMFIENLIHQKIASVVRNAYRTFGCRVADQALGNFTDVSTNFSFWFLQDCTGDETALAAAAIKALVGSIYVSTNNTETQVLVYSGETSSSSVRQPTEFKDAIVVASEPILGVDTLLMLAGLAILVDVGLSFVKPGESDYLSVVAPLVREMAGVDCLDNPLQAEKGHVIRFARIMRGGEGHVGYTRMYGDVVVDEFAKDTVVRASAHC